MEESFWHERWRNGAIGFHLSEPNALLTAHFHRLQLASGSRVFVPLCGKTRDIGWLLGQGYRVVGAELSRLAIDDLFAELGVTPLIEEEGALVRYSAPSIDVLVGNIFEVSNSVLGPVHATYDRAALIALPEPMRVRYAEHLVSITQAAPQLLVAFEYDQRMLEGPPFSVESEEVQRLYSASYELTVAELAAVEGGLKGRVPAFERVWLLRKSLR